MIYRRLQLSAPSTKLWNKRMALLSWHLTFFWIMGTGKAIINTPTIQPTLPTSFPITVCGTRSPYLKHSDMQTIGELSCILMQFLKSFYPRVLRFEHCLCRITKTGELHVKNRPFYSCLLNDLAFEWQQGWRRLCFDTDLTAFVVLMLTRCIYMTNTERSVSKQGHLQPCCHSKAGQSRQL